MLSLVAALKSRAYAEEAFCAACIPMIVRVSIGRTVGYEDACVFCNECVVVLYMYTSSFT